MKWPFRQTASTTDQGEAASSSSGQSSTFRTLSTSSSGPRTRSTNLESDKEPYDRAAKNSFLQIDTETTPEKDKKGEWPEKDANDVANQTLPKHRDADIVPPQPKKAATGTNERVAASLDVATAPRVAKGSTTEGVPTRRRAVDVPIRGLRPEDWNAVANGTLPKHRVDIAPRAVKPEKVASGTNEGVAASLDVEIPQSAVNFRKSTRRRAVEPATRVVRLDKDESGLTNERLQRPRDVEVATPGIMLEKVKSRAPGEVVPSPRDLAIPLRSRRLRGKDDSVVANGLVSRRLTSAPLQTDGEAESHTASDAKIVLLEDTVLQLRTQLAESQHKADILAQLLQAHEKKHQCEALYARHHIIEATKSLLEIIDTIGEAVKVNKLIMEWISEFTDRCISTLERIGDEASNVGECDKAILAYFLLLSLGPPGPDSVLIKWGRVILTRGSVNDALKASTELKLPKFICYRTICDILEGDGRVREAIMSFRQLQSELARETNIPAERVQWEHCFQRRCTERLEKLASDEMDSKKYNQAAEHLSIILSLDSVNRTQILIKRSRVRVLMSLWEDALNDADEAIKLDPSSHQGYEMRHAATYGAGHYDQAVEAFRIMLSKLEESPDEHVRELRCQYVDPTLTIRRIVQQTIRDMPRVLINTTTGCLCDKKQQADAFEALPIYNELLSSMTREIDLARVWREVKEFYRYVMLSHKWEEDGEPLLQKVEHITVYELETSLANMKLQTFCATVRSLGFRWAWSDTCCVDKVNNVVLQESLVAMFTWYRGSSMTIVYLRDVSSQLQKSGGLQRSIWNTRAWTYQEYVAAEVVRFYTKDWKPYLDLNIPNHKDSSTIVSEMQQATTGSAQDMTLLRPGLDRVREKLSLASMRQTTLVEDIAYSLLGIFNVSIPVIYGEGDRAVGRLLEHILTGSGDVTILAWTGRAGSYNSCLPADLAVYSQVVSPHVPQPIESSKMNDVVMLSRSSLPDLSLAMTLYNRLSELPSPSAAASRLRLPGIISRLTDLDHTLDAARKHVYRAMTSMFGRIEIKTADELTQSNDLYLVHPWIRPLLDQEFTHGAATLDEATQAIRLVARLRQPFGALLVEQLSRVEYKRVAADSSIMVQLDEEVPLTDLMKSVRTIEVQ